jgi:hypothetical protein
MSDIKPIEKEGRGEMIFWTGMLISTILVALSLVLFKNVIITFVVFLLSLFVTVIITPRSYMETTIVGIEVKPIESDLIWNIKHGRCHGQKK